MTDVEEQGGDGSVAVDVDHAQVVGQVAFSGAHEEKPFETHIHKIWCAMMIKTVVSDGGRRGDGVLKCTRSPGGCQNGGVESSEAGQRHGQWDGPVHHAKHLVCKRLGKNGLNGVMLHS